MAKEANATGVVVAPWFAMARTVLDELDQHTGAWIEQGIAQTSEVGRIARTLREQTSGIVRTSLQTAEQITSGAAEYAAAWAKPFTRGIA